jgi:ATP-dependent DNA helicase RecQ
MPDIQVTLCERFGFADFRPGQREAVECLLGGQHALVVMPTGAGKSLVYQLASLRLPGVTLVLSPLISLMQDQVEHLQRRQIPAAFINSTLPATEQAARLRALGQGEWKLVYVAPERLRSAPFRQALARTRISLLAVDEAHCISQWGHDFRPDYLHIAAFRRELGEPLTAALTATATPQVQGDITSLLGIPSAQQVIPNPVV